MAIKYVEPVYKVTEKPRTLWEGGELLGDLSYSDVTNDTDTYHRIIEGETFARAVAWHLGIEAPEPQDPEYPGAELLETFTKLA